MKREYRIVKDPWDCFSAQWRSFWIPIWRHIRVLGRASLEQAKLDVENHKKKYRSDVVIWRDDER